MTQESINAYSFFIISVDVEHDLENKKLWRKLVAQFYMASLETLRIAAQTTQAARVGPMRAAQVAQPF